MWYIESAQASGGSFGRRKEVLALQDKTFFDKAISVCGNTVDKAEHAPVVQGGGKEKSGAVGAQKAGGKPKGDPTPADERLQRQRRLQRIWSRRMALVGLKRIYHAALEGARTEIRDEDGALVEVKFNPTAANAATKAIEVANRMLGYTAPEGDGEGEGADGAGALRVTLGDAEELAL